MGHDLRPPAPPRTAISAGGSATVKSPQIKLWLLFGFVLVILLLVLLVLPSMITDPVITQQAPVIKPQQNAVVEKHPEAVDADQFRADAEHALQDFLRLQAQPDLNNASVWAPEDWQLAINSALQGDQEFGQRSFAAALEAYQYAGEQLQNLLNDREHILQQSLDSGWQYLQEDAVIDSSAAFERVLAMQADHQQAQLGLERAAVREQVLELVTSARQAVISNTLGLAAEAYTLALQLDPLYSPAREALEEVETELHNRAFRDTMGLALQALDSGRFTVAEKALMEAAKIYPADPALKETFQRLSTARRQANLRSLRKRAVVLLKNEDWTAAIDQYQRALKIDSQASFARNGLDRAQEKQQLHQQLDHYLSDTTRLYSDDPLENAGKLLAANQQTAAGEPLLAEKLAALQQAVTLAVIPVELLILSDNLTQVTIYKVGRLGSFEQKRLSLRPGKYTVTGSRQGYRDVLKVIELRPGQDGQSLKIETEEQF